MTSVSKNVYINKLTGILNKYNNANHITIKMNPADLKSSQDISTLIDKIIRKILNLKLLII